MLCQTVGKGKYVGAAPLGGPNPARRGRRAPQGEQENLRVMGGEDLLCQMVGKGK